MWMVEKKKICFRFTKYTAPKKIRENLKYGMRTIFLKYCTQIGMCVIKEYRIIKEIEILYGLGLKINNYKKN